MLILHSYFAKAPTYLGKPEDFLTSTIEGKLYASLHGDLLEVVKVTSHELQKLSLQIPEGLYVVGTGSTGAAEALAVMGGAYFSIMMLSALSIKTPPTSYIPPEPYTVEDKPPEPPVPIQRPIPIQHKVSPVYTVDQAFRSPQFHLLGLSFLCVSTCGMGLFSVAKPMMSEIFSSALPALVTSTFAANYLLGMSAGNLGGRLGWSALSDWLGRKKVFNIITLGSIPIYLCMPSLVVSTIQTGDTLPLYAFCTLSSLAISGMGGVYAMLPAYEADIFGSKYVGPIHGRMLLYSSVASLMGPYILIYLRSIAEHKAIHELMRNFSQEEFVAAFGAPIEQASQLIATKTLTINKLLAASPFPTLDPSPYLYDNTMYTLAGLMGVAALTHGLVHTQRVKSIAGRNEGECGTGVSGVED
ncbi:MFS transporter, partial [archaeon]